jgi:hypothetical protein
MRHPNCLDSFFGRDSNFCVALVARKYGRSAGVSRAMSARFSEGGSIRGFVFVAFRSAESRFRHRLRPMGQQSRSRGCGCVTK